MSYISNDREDWTTTLFYNDKEVGRCVWSFGVEPTVVRDFGIFDETEGEIPSSFSVQGDTKEEYVLPKVDDDDGRIPYTIELRGDNGTQLAEWITLHKVGSKHTLKFKPEIADEGKTFLFSIHLLKKDSNEG